MSTPAEDPRTTAFALMAAYPTTDLTVTRETASAHLRSLNASSRGTPPQGTLREASAMCGVVLADALVDLGCVDESVPVLTTAGRHAAAGRHTQLLSWIAGTRALGHSHRGDPREALNVIEPALAVAAVDPPTMTRLWVIAGLACALRGTGGTEAASAFWLANAAVATRPADETVYGVAFETPSMAEVACADAARCVVSPDPLYRQTGRAVTLATTWTPTVDRAGHRMLSAGFRAAHALALVHAAPREAAGIMADALDRASDPFVLTATTRLIMGLYVERARATAPSATIDGLAARYESILSSHLTPRV